MVADHTAAKLVNDQGVVSLENMRIIEADDDQKMSSDESEVEVVRHVPPVAAQEARKRIHEVGKTNHTISYH